MSYTHNTDIAIICQDDKIKIAKEFCAGLLEKHKEENIFKGEDGKYHYVYLTINTVNNKFYVGKHTTDSLNDGYIGSGNLLSNAIKKYSIHIFTNYKLKFFNKEQDAYDYELSLVSEDMIKKFKDELNITYNLRAGGVGGSAYMSKETRSKISKASKESHARPEVKEKLSISSSKNWSNPIYREKIVSSSIDNWSDPSYRNKVSNSVSESLNRPEVKAKLSKASKERWSNPEYKEKVSTSIKEVRSSEESRNKTSQKSKELWLDTTYRENHRKAMDIVREDPVCKEKHRQATKEAMNRPEVKAKLSQSLKEYYSNEDVRKEWSKKMKVVCSSLEYKTKISKASKEQFINKPMIDLNGNVVKVHTDEILSKLKEGWTLNLKNGILHNPITQKKARIYLTEENGHKNLISLLEQGWLFGHLPLEYKEEAVIEYGEYCEKRKMPALF
jgi:hypothetical protein